MEFFLISLFEALILYGCPLPPGQYGVLVACCFFSLPEQAHVPAPLLRCVVLLSWVMGRAACCEAVSLEHGGTAWERDVRFPCMPLYAFPAPLRGTPKFSSLRHSEGIPRIPAHHYCDLYVVVDS